MRRLRPPTTRLVRSLNAIACDESLNLASPCIRCLSGSNKWSKIKRKKAIKDQRRGAIFSKASRAIAVASRLCGGDIGDLALQSAIARAKSIELPKSRIEAAIAAHESKSSDAAPLSLRYDAMMSFAGTKVACLITALSDNRNRTASNVRSSVAKSGGELLPTSTHDYLFDHVGMVLLENLSEDAFNEEALWECALEAGATEVDIDDGSAVITCDRRDLWDVVKGLRDGGFDPTEFEHRYIVSDEATKAPLSSDGEERLKAFLDKMEVNEDVTNVFHNAKDVG